MAAVNDVMFRGCHVTISVARIFENGIILSFMEPSEALLL